MTATIGPLFPYQAREARTCEVKRSFRPGGGEGCGTASSSSNGAVTLGMVCFPKYHFALATNWKEVLCRG
jgi:hypothetical protein